jgi:hypothetical protein
MGCLVDPRDGLDVLEMRQISCTYRDPNPGPSSPWRSGCHHHHHQIWTCVLRINLDLTHGVMLLMKSGGSLILMNFASETLRIKRFVLSVISNNVRNTQLCCVILLSLYPITGLRQEEYFLLPLTGVFPEPNQNWPELFEMEFWARVYNCFSPYLKFFSTFLRPGYKSSKYEITNWRFRPLIRVMWALSETQWRILIRAYVCAVTEITLNYSVLNLETAEKVESTNY